MDIQIFNRQQQLEYVRSMGKRWERGLQSSGLREPQYFIELEQPLYAFKKTHTARRPSKQEEHLQYQNRNVLVNLIIPAGAVVHVSEASLKMRASEAQVHSQFYFEKCSPAHIVRKHSDSSRQFTMEWLNANMNLAPEATDGSFSTYATAQTFKYRNGQTVRPDSFDRYGGTCKPGIHFFLNVLDALCY